MKGSSVLPPINVSPRIETLVKLNLIRLNLPRTRAPDAILVFNSAASRDEKMKGGKISTRELITKRAKRNLNDPMMVMLRDSREGERGSKKKPVRRVSLIMDWSRERRKI